MDCRTGPTVTRCGLAATLRNAGALALALCAAGCGGGSYVQVGSAGSSGAGVQGTSALGALIAIGVLGGYAYESERNMEGTRRLPAPPMDTSRTVNEQDCTQPIADWSANLKCR